MDQLTSKKRSLKSSMNYRILRKIRILCWQLAEVIRQKNSRLSRWPGLHVSAVPLVRSASGRELGGTTPTALPPMNERVGHVSDGCDVAAGGGHGAGLDRGAGRLRTRASLRR